jgi:hypothetical protein
MSADVDRGGKSSIKYYRDLEAETIIIDIGGSVRESKTVVPISTEDFDNLKKEILWGSEYLDLYSGCSKEDYENELTKRRKELAASVLN